MKLWYIGCQGPESCAVWGLSFTLGDRHYVTHHMPVKPTNRQVRKFKRDARKRYKGASGV